MSNTKLKHKTPCSECPWRRKHLAGWLGGYSAEQFIDQVHHDGPALPCHKTFPEDGSEPNQVSMCAGALIHMKNACKLPANPEVRKAREQVEADHENVFSFAHEFLAHHKGENVFSFPDDGVHPSKLEL